MNAKEQIIDILKYIKGTGTYIKESHNNDIDHLIAATEAAIFDVPSEKEITNECMKFTDTAKNVQNAIIYTVGFGDGINFILNYKKHEHDGK